MLCIFILLCSAESFLTPRRRASSAPWTAARATATAARATATAAPIDEDAAARSRDEARSRGEALVDEARTPVEVAVSSLAATTLSLILGDEAAAERRFCDKDRRREAVRAALDHYDLCGSGTLSRDEAKDLWSAGRVTDLGAAPPPAATTRIFRGDGSRHRRGVLHADIPRRRVAAPPRGATRI